ncbi:MAG: hypothetical protein AB7I30_03100 [Isosphaeraceae bacterium]
MALFAGAVLTGCGGGATDDFPREAISGKVSLDGKPLDSGSISFDPDGNQPHPVSVGAPIVGGFYSISKADGPTPGTYRISIYGGGGGGPPEGEAPGMPPKATKDPVPAKYNAQSTLKAEVKSGGTNSFDFDLATK